MKKTSKNKYNALYFSGSKFSVNFLNEFKQNLLQRKLCSQALKYESTDKLIKTDMQKKYFIFKNLNVHLYLIM